MLPPLPLTGTSTFVALGAGRAGHVGVVFYHSETAGDPGFVAATTSWDAVYAESTDALSAAPHWTITTAEADVHRGVICATAGCMGSGRFAGDFLDTGFDADDRPLVVWQRDRPKTDIRFAAGSAVAARPVQVPPVRRPLTPPPAAGGSHLAATGLGEVPLLAVPLLVLAWVLRRRKVVFSHAHR